MPLCAVNSPAASFVSTMCHVAPYLYDCKFKLLFKIIINCHENWNVIFWIFKSYNVRRLNQRLICKKKMLIDVKNLENGCWSYCFSRTSLHCLQAASMLTPSVPSVNFLIWRKIDHWTNFWWKSWISMRFLRFWRQKKETNKIVYGSCRGNRRSNRRPPVASPCPCPFWRSTFFFFTMVSNFQNWKNFTWIRDVIKSTKLKTTNCQNENDSNKENVLEN